MSITYSDAIMIRENSRQGAEDLQLFADIKDSSLQPNVITYSDAISTCEMDEQGQRLCISLLTCGTPTCSRMLSPTVPLPALAKKMTKEQRLYRFC